MKFNLTYIFLYGNWSPHNGYRKTKLEKNLQNYKDKHDTENYSCWCTHFQQFIP